MIWGYHHSWIHPYWKCTGEIVGDCHSIIIPLKTLHAQIFQQKHAESVWNSRNTILWNYQRGLKTFHSFILAITPLKPFMLSEGASEFVRKLNRQWNFNEFPVSNDSLPIILSIWVRASWVLFWTAKLLRCKESLHECALKITGWHAQFKICRSAKSFLVKLTVPLNRGQFCQQPTRLNEFPEIFCSKTAFKILWKIILCLAKLCSEGSVYKKEKQIKITQHKQAWT